MRGTNMFFICFVLLCSLTLSLAAVPQQITYQGKLTDTWGVGLNGNYELEFEIFNTEAGGTELWSETHLVVAVEKGIFGVVLGQINTLDLLFDEQYWLQISVDGTILAPRLKLTTEAYAFRAIWADSIDGISWGSIGDVPDEIMMEGENVALLNVDTLGAYSLLGHNHALSTLSDVNAAWLLTGQALVWNGLEWVPQYAGGAVFHTLDDAYLDGNVIGAIYGPVEIIDATKPGGGLQITAWDSAQSAIESRLTFLGNLDFPGDKRTAIKSTLMHDQFPFKANGGLSTGRVTDDYYRMFAGAFGSIDTTRFATELDSAVVFGALGVQILDPEAIPPGYDSLVMNTAVYGYSPDTDKAKHWAGFFDGNVNITGDVNINGVIYTDTLKTPGDESDTMVAMSQFKVYGELIADSIQAVGNTVIIDDNLFVDGDLDVAGDATINSDLYLNSGLHDGTGFGTAGQVLKTDGSDVYWDVLGSGPDGIDTLRSTSGNEDDTIWTIAQFYVNGELIADSIQAVGDTLFLDDHVKVDGNVIVPDDSVAIGIDTPNFRLHVEDVTGDGEPVGYFVNNASAPIDGFGVYGESAQDDYYGIGVYGIGGWLGVAGDVYPSGSGDYYGVYGYVDGGDGDNYGLFGESWGDGSNYGTFGLAIDNGSGLSTNYGIFTEAWMGYENYGIFAIAVGDPAAAGTGTGSYGIFGYAVDSDFSYGGVLLSLANGVDGGESYGMAAISDALGGIGSYSYGFYTESYDADYTYGLYAEASTGGSECYGIYASALGGVIENWAGYFADGDVLIENDIYLGGGLDDGTGFGAAGQMLKTDGSDIYWTDFGGDVIEVDTIRAESGLTTDTVVAHSQFKVFGELIADSIQAVGDTVFIDDNLKVNDSLIVSGDAYVSGDVGIGINTPGAELHIVEAISPQEIIEATNNGGNSQLLLKTSGGVNDYLQIYKGGPTAAGTVVGMPMANLSLFFAGVDAGPMMFDVTTANPMVFATGNTERMRILGTGEVGIGTPTPSALLDVGGGTVNFIDGTDDVLIADDLEVDGTIFGAINPGFTQGSVVFADATGALAQDNPNFFWDDATDRLGIGTAIPSGQLHINQADAEALYFSRAGHDTYRVGLAGGTGIYFQNMTDARTELVFLGDGNIGMGTLNPMYPLEIERAGDVTLGLDNTTANRWFFKSDNNGDLDIYNSTGAYSAILVDGPTGNVGIGTAIPGEKLDVAGKTKTQSIQITNGAVNGRVLTSDASGNASWQSPPSRTRSILITPGMIDLSICVAPPTKINKGGWNVPCLAFANNVLQQIRFIMPIPSDWNGSSSFTFKVLWSSPATAGNVQFSTSWAPVELNENTTAPSFGGGSPLASPSAVAEGLVETTVMTITPNAADKFVSIRIRRDGGNPTDTIENVMHMFGVNITYND